MTHNSGNVIAIFSHFLTRVAFKILARVVSNSLLALIKIAYPGWNKMEKVLEVTVCSKISGRLLTLDVKCWKRYIITPPWPALLQGWYSISLSSFKDLYCICYIQKSLYARKKNGLIG